MEISGKHVLITGGAVRCGAELVRAFAASGAVVTVHCRASREAGERLLSGLPGTGHSLVSADFSSGASGADDLWRRLRHPVDILINNASCYRLPDERVELYELVNHAAPLELMLRFAEQSGLSEGVVINILDQSLLSSRPLEETRYLESRRKLLSDTLRFAREYGGKNLRFNAVAPGPMLPPRGLENSKMEKTLAGVPLKRPVLLGDFAAAVLFLVGCSSITGAILPVDCGQHV